MVDCGETWCTLSSGRGDFVITAEVIMTKITVRVWVRALGLKVSDFRVLEFWVRVRLRVKVRVKSRPFQLLLHWCKQQRAQFYWV